MASASNAARLCALACRRAPQVSRVPRTRRIAHQCALARRTFSSSPAPWAARPKSRDDEPGGAEDDVYTNRPLELKRMKESFAQSATPEGLQQLDELAKMNGFNTIDDYLQNAVDNGVNASEERNLDDALMSIDIGPRPNRESFWYDEEDPEMNTEEVDEFDEDDITSMAHGKLDEIRDMRQYARLTVWEMPLLSKLAKPFEVPKDNQVFRWRYTTYMGEAHPGERKVVLQFAPDDLKLSPVQTNKLKKLAGARYNPEKELIKMSCDSFEHQAQNKRYLSNLVDDLVAAAKDPKDTFEDVPLDTRHHEFKSKPRFPKQWRLTDERRAELNDYRQQQLALDMEKETAGQLVSGQKVIEEHLMQKMLQEQEKEKAAELVAASQPAKGNRARR